MFNSFWNKYGEKIISISKGAAIAAIGAGLTNAISQIGNIDFGVYTTIVAAGVAVIVNIIRKFGIPLAIILFKGQQL